MLHPQAAVLEHHIREHALGYFPELSAQTLSVTLTGVDQRPWSVLLRYRVADSAATYPVLVKIRQQDKARLARRASSRPNRRIVDPEEAYWMEYAAMKVIYDHFSTLNDPRFGAIRVLDALPEIGAIIMIESHDPDLRPLFARRNRIGYLFRRDKLYDVFRNAGGWLRAFHAMPLDTYVKRRDATRDDYERNIDELTAYLLRHVGELPALRRVQRGLDTSALQDNLPLARGHGDYSLRNILVGEHKRVTGIDTLARWEIPIYEDIGYFLVRLHTNRVQVFSRGLAYSPQWIARCEEEFLGGYFPTECVPTQAIALFQILALLDQWAAVIEPCLRRSSRGASLRNTLRCSFSNRLYEQILNRLLREEGQGHEYTQHSTTDRRS